MWIKGQGLLKVCSCLAKAVRGSLRQLETALEIRIVCGRVGGVVTFETCGSFCAELNLEVICDVGGDLMLDLGELRSSSLVGLSPDLFAGADVEELDWNLQLAVGGLERAGDEGANVHLTARGAWVELGTVKAASDTAGCYLESRHIGEVIRKCLRDAGAEIVEVGVAGVVRERQHCK